MLVKCGSSPAEEVETTQSGGEEFMSDLACRAVNAMSRAGASKQRAESQGAVRTRGVTPTRPQLWQLMARLAYQGGFLARV